MPAFTSLIDPALMGLGAVLIFSLALWIVSFARGDVSIVDSAWSLFQLIAALVYFTQLEEVGTRGALVVAVIALWALRLSGYITWRNWGEPEDYRYRRIRANNEPHFAWKSLYIVFGLQGVLGWLMSIPALLAMANPAPLSWLDTIGFGVFMAGFLFEAIGDAQLARFKRDPANRGQVMRSGLWRYTRHPNYFGEFCMAWGLFIVAASAGGWWSVFAPLLMSFLLLKVSGVAMLEKDIGERRPAYRDYMRTTSAFFPRPPRAR
jgi:steroid 5-alpha reductase family enzyme